MSPYKDYTNQEDIDVRHERSIKNRTIKKYTILSIVFAFSIFLFAAIGTGLIAYYENPTQPDNMDIGEKQDSNTKPNSRKNKKYEIAALICFGIAVVCIPLCMYATTKIFKLKE
jgi:hypothetical protein